MPQKGGKGKAVPNENVRPKSSSMADNFLESIPEFNLLYFFRTETVRLCLRFDLNMFSGAAPKPERLRV